jgi:two-component system chemotaxis response regulator CheY
MKILIVDDDFTCRNLLKEMTKSYGSIHMAVNGKEAVDAVSAAMAAGEPYDLICLDVMMPEMDGQQALAAIRALEVAQGINSSKGAKIVMATALGDAKNAIASFKNLCDAYVVKPIDKVKLLNELRKLKLIE